MKVKVNRAGFFFILICVFLGVAGVNTANNLLYIVVSCMLSFMLISGIFSILNLRAIQAKLLPQPELYANRESTLKILLINKKPYPSFLLKVGLYESFYFCPLLKKEAEARLRATFKTRGEIQKLQINISSTFPVGLFERIYELEIPAKILVYPEPIFSDINLLPEVADLSGQSVAQRTPGFDEIDSIKNYSGEPLKLIHWKSSAKRSKLMSKRMQQEGQTPVVLSLECVDGNLEQKLGKLTFLVNELLKRSRPVGLELGDIKIKPDLGNSHRHLLLKTLALF
ncbi:MAG: DUF58 domain-containing protein [Aquificaceae bacterium]